MTVTERQLKVMEKRALDFASGALTDNATAHKMAGDVTVLAYALRRLREALGTAQAETLAIADLLLREL
jgi:hypothetical protein